jgi:hypothetical protein
MFAIFAESPEDTTRLFMFQCQDWNGKYVLLLNPVYEDLVVRKNIARVRFTEMFLPISTPSQYVQLPAQNLCAQILDNTTGPGPVPFAVKTGKVVVQSAQGSTETCANPVCDGRHLEGTRCAIPFYKTKPFPITGFSVLLTLPEYPDLGSIRLSSTTFSLLFCSEKYLKFPHLYNKGAHMVPDVVQSAFDFYSKTGYLFEVGGVAFARKDLSQDLVVYKALASYFHVLKEGPKPYPGKIDPRP